MAKTANKLNTLQANGEAPEWMTEESYKTLCGGYLLDTETPKQMYLRVADSVASYLGKPDMAQKFFDAMWNNWLCPSTPVLCNSGTDRGLPISCFSSAVADDTSHIFDTVKEVAMLSKFGGGTAVHMSALRAKGSEISRGGKTDGVVPFAKIFDSVAVGISQGGVRRGSTAVYLDIEHNDFDEFINIRRPQGDINRQCLNLHHGVTISDSFMQKVVDGDGEARRRWKELIKTRFETGEPYVVFIDNVNNNNPAMYADHNLSVKGSNLCSEIFLHTDAKHSLVCCLSSLNLARWDEWKDTDVVETSTWFLDGVMSEFLDKAKKLPGFERSINFAQKSRALGLGVLGLHSLFQRKGMAFDDLQAYLLNGLIFKTINERTLKASQDLAKEFGEPEWCKGHGVRNSHRVALAPTVSNSLIASNVSPGIEPWAANGFSQKSAKGTFIRKNPELVSLLESLGKNDDETWKSIVLNEGSVQHLDFLTEEQKKVFLTAREINQFVVVKLAGQRQKFIDQGQSLNLFFPSNADTKYINQVHIEAWKNGVKSLYYMRTSSVLKGDAGSREYKRDISECSYCEG